MTSSDNFDDDPSSNPELAGQSADHAAERANEDEDLRISVAALTRLSSRELGLEELLTRVARLAVAAIPGADGAGLTLLEERRADTIVATASFVSDIDAIQYGLGQGPCISAAADGVTIRSGSLGADPRWPRFGRRIARLGVHSVVSLPLVTTKGVVGAMNVYAHDKHVFDERAVELGELYAAPAAIAVQNAQLLAETRRLVERMQTALESRRVVDQAIGVTIARSGGTSEQALERLRVLSQHEQTKLVEVAARIVAEAARRARSRHTDH